MEKQQYTVKIFYMKILCITLKEINTKQLVQNWLLPMSPSTEWSWYFIEFVILFYLLCIGLLQYSKTAWSKVGTSTVYMFIRCILMPENGTISRKSCKMNHIFTMLSSSEVSFQHFQIKQRYIYIYWECLAYTFYIMRCYLFFYFFLFKTKDLNSIKKYVESWKAGNFTTHYVYYVYICENSILYIINIK